MFRKCWAKYIYDQCSKVFPNQKSKKSQEEGNEVHLGLPCVRQNPEYGAQDTYTFILAVLITEAEAVASYY